jgi:hypothetical protein
MKRQITDTVKDGRLNTSEAQFKAILAAFSGEVVTITIEKKKRRRTSPQNRWYFGVAVDSIYHYLNETGNQISREDTHGLIKVAIAKRYPQLMLDEIVIEHSGEILKRIKSTTELTTTDFMGYKEAIQEWAMSTFGLDIPDPN